MKSTIRITLFLVISCVLASKSQADEFIKLHAKVEESKFVLLEKKYGDYSLTPPSRYIDEEIYDDLIKAKDASKIKDEIIYSLKEGEAIQLDKPIFTVSGTKIQKADFPKVFSDRDDQRWNTWHPSYNGNLIELQPAGARLDVKFPESSNWYNLYYRSNTGWHGLNTNNPMIIGPCDLKLTYMANVTNYYTYVSPEEDERYGINITAGMAWLFAKKINLGSSSSATTTAQSLVLPEDSGDLTIIMEGSNDLINWTREDLGKKPEANRKTFYRIRAVKE